MKFAIITHAAHKLNEQEIFAYEPYVREMNLWLKFVDEVKIVAPVSKESISALDSCYQFYTKSHDLEQKKQIASSHTPRNDEQERHSEQSEAISLNQQIASSHTPRNDDRICHPEPVEGSHDSEHKKQIPNQVRDDGIKLIEISSFDITSTKNSIKAIINIPKICYNIYKTMQWADHIHLRCPGNIGLLGCFVQILFPNKPKTIKYAGNWDPNSKQPFSYRLQKWILSNTFLTRNAKVLVYGDWPNQTKNIVPFFTASYSEKELLQEDEQIATSQTPRNDEMECHPEQACTEFSRSIEGSLNLENDDEMLKQVQHDEQKEQIASSHTPCLPNRQTRNDETTCHPEQACTEFSRSIEESHDFELKDKSLRQAQTDISKDQIPNQVGNDGKINFLFVGALTKGKQPLLSVKVIQELKKKGYKIQLNIYGEGEERKIIEQYIETNKLGNEVVLYGNASKEIIKKAFQNSHFLLFISKSEGWPKVVAEAMFWACLPISSSVSCIPYLLDNGNRGAIVNSDVNEIVAVVVDYLKDEEKYKTQVKRAMEWSRKFTLEKFEEEIGKLLE